MMAFAMLTLGSSLILAADGVPNFKVEPSCKAAVAQAVIVGRDMQSCMASENSARDTLKTDWSTYPAADKSQCTQEASMGGSASFVELLVCLEMLRDTRAAKKEPMTTPTDAPAASSATAPRRRH